MGNLDADQRRRAATALFEVSEFLRHRQIRHWLDFGTLLGAHRAQSIIPHDYDLDLTLEAPNAEVEQALAELLSGGRFRRGDWEVGSRYQVIPAEGPLAIDLYLCVRTGTRVTMVGRERFSFPWFFIDELEMVTLEGFTFNTPRHRVQFLTLRYGHDFMTPQPFCKALNLPWPEVQRNVVAVKSIYTGYVSGTFNPFDEEHLSLLRGMKGCFDRVIVGIEGENTAGVRSQALHVLSQQLRELIAGCGYVDQVVQHVEAITTSELLDRLGADFFVIRRDREALLGEIYRGPHERVHVVSMTAGRLLS